jgi:hypothetical protein
MKCCGVVVVVVLVEVEDEIHLRGKEREGGEVLSLRLAEMNMKMGDFARPSE